ncbi:sporulation initiation factor Spo0A C-terminal domain-containing protein [Metabacillus fastidiosus]|uniref:sporulation initiation factor Spo0A C-terminal domain-containing protein n=1 Tax=Metabacillus fastidiosus TaxID=1458 RepID=UPI002E20793D|nr:sporulation initiation factor Spo0A C-terminal domain-containing protein [Metabacillus fastidiosus]
MNEKIKQKAKKTIERIQKAIEYNDNDYMKELILDLAELSYFEGLKEGRNSPPITSTIDEVNKIPGLTSYNLEYFKSQIFTVLFKLGIPNHIKGFRYLTDALLLTYEDSLLLSAITKELYPYIAKKYNTTASRVERAIRHAIEIGWNRGNKEDISSILGYPITNTTLKPTNSEYINLLVKYLKNSCLKNDSAI